MHADDHDPSTDPRESDPSAGDGGPRLLGGRYRLEQLIASGGMASVWQARDELLDRTVAVKLLHDHLADDEEFRERFRREAVAAAKLTHPHIVSLYDTGHQGRSAWLVMELVEGTTLREEMDDTGPLDPARVAAVGERVARGLGYAHSHGLVHRDVKPANVLIGDDGTVKVADFGIAKVAGSGDDLTGTGAVLGTAAYVAPEQILDEPLDGACDQYALGCVLYEALTGRRPFTGDTPVAIAAQRLKSDPPPPRALRPDVPDGLEAVIRRALARRPADRYPTADALADALAPFTGDDPVDPSPPPSPAAAPHRTVALHAPAAPPSRTPPASATRRWAPRTLVVPALAVVVAALVGAAILGGQGGRVGLGGADGRDSDPDLVAPADITLFDPDGTGSEDASGLTSLLDGDPSTTWSSVGYNTPDFGGLKPGLGFWLDLGGPHAVSSLALRTTTPGITYEVRLADEPADTLDGWQPIGARADASELSQVTLDEPVVTRHLLVWVTGGLQPDGSGRYRVEFAELAVRGHPS